MVMVHGQQQPLTGSPESGMQFVATAGAVLPAGVVPAMVTAVVHLPAVLAGYIQGQAFPSSTEAS